MIGKFKDIVFQIVIQITVLVSEKVMGKLEPLT